MICLRSFIIAALIMISAVSAFAEGGRQLILDIGNDFFTGPDHTDRHLTNNISVGVIYEGLPNFASSWKDSFSENQKVFTSFSISQFMYTPEDTSLSVPDPADQPYAGWLFASASLAVREPKLLNVFEMDFGIVGPSSLAEETQSAYHALIGVDQAEGWKYQLHDELGINARFRQAVLGYRSNGKGDSDFIIFYGGSIGNVDTHAEVGSIVRFGLNVPDDMGYRAGADYDDPFSFFGVLRIVQKIVARDIFLDGNSDGDSPSVEKRPLLTSGSAGLVARYEDFEFGYSYEMSTKRFKTQSTSDSRGNISLSYRRKF